MPPIRPEEVATRKLLLIPEFVIDAFNDLIAGNAAGRSATIKQKDAVEAILKRMPEPDRGKIYEEHWLDVEDIYREAGWKVEYDKPGYNESYEATFKFTGNHAAH